MRTILAALLLLACAFAPAAAQVPVPAPAPGSAPPSGYDASRNDLRGMGVGEGSRVRLTAPVISPEPMVGRVAGLTRDSLLLSRGGGARLQIETRQLRSLSVSAGHNRWTWALAGAGVGLLVGGVAGGTAGGHGDTSGFGGLAGFIAGVLVGTPVGAGVGAAVAPERWTPVPLPHPAG
jgi:hypothetical protein